MKFRMRGSFVAAMAHAVHNASSSASQNEIGVAPKWKAASNGRQRHHDDRCRRYGRTGNPGDVPIVARQGEERDAGDEGEQDRAQYEHQCIPPATSA